MKPSRVDFTIKTEITLYVYPSTANMRARDVDSYSTRKIQLGGRSILMSDSSFVKRQPSFHNIKPCFFNVI